MKPARSKLAVLSLILGVLPFCIVFLLPLSNYFYHASLFYALSRKIMLFSVPLAFIAALILGIIALVKISKSKAEIKGMEMATAGVVLGGTFLILIALFPLLLLGSRGKIDKKVATESELRSIQAALEMYYIENDKYPSTDQGLKKLIEEREIDEGALRDTWKHPYNYEAIAIGNAKGQDYHLSSSGPDGIKGTEDDIQAPIGEHSFIPSDKE